MMNRKKVEISHLEKKEIVRTEVKFYWVSSTNSFNFEL